MKKTLLILVWLYCLIPVQNVFSQTMAVSGKITEGTEPLPGVSVKVKGTRIGASTNANGEFSLQAAKDAVLVISSLGYLTKEVPVNGKTFIIANLEADRKKLNEVVVVGYGVQKKITMTGAVVSVSGDDLIKAPVAGISNALTGLASGMQVVQNSGEFGADEASIRIRGIATLNTGGASPLILVDGVERNTYNNIDPHEIESINILKDASSTAVFGVRGANGVILITTRQGQVGDPKIDFTSNLAMIQPSILPNYLNSYDYATLRNEAERNMGKTPSFSEEDLRLYQTGEDPIFHPDKNWIDELIKPFSLQQSYNANVSGGTEKLRYFTSLGYFNQSGAYRQPEQDFGFPYKQNYDKYNLRTNFDFNLTDDFSISVKLGDQITDNSSPNGGAWGAFDKASRTAPMSGPGFVDGKYIENIIGLPKGVPYFNPWGQAGPTSTGGAFITDDFSNTINTNISLKYKLDKLTPGLSVRAMGAYDSYYLKEDVRKKEFPAYTVMKNPNDPSKYILYQSSDEGPYNGLTEGVADNHKWRKMYVEAAVDYKRTFGGAHNISGLILGTMQKEYDPTLQYKLPTAYEGLVGRITYDYKNRYLSEFNMGYNGSENFPEDKRFGFFPSFSLGWVATEEPFLPKNKWLSFLKIRGSYGEVGNDKIGFDRYLYLNGPYTLGNGSYQAAVFGTAGSNMARYQLYKEGKLGNQDVTWERAKKWNVGTDVHFLSDRLTFTGDFFGEKRDNILWTLSTVPELVAATLPPANIGKVDNHGYELEAGYNDKIGSVGYWLKGSYSFARNKIIFEDEPSHAYEWMQQTGRPVGQYFGLTFEGFYNSVDEINDPNRPISKWEAGGLQPGDMKYKDLNNDGKIDENDMGPVGYSNWPEITYSFSGGFSWKGLDLSILFQGTGNVSVSYASSAAYPFTADWGPAQKWALERWTPERYANGDKIDYPRLELSPGTQHNYQASDFWIQNGSYLRLKNVEIGYRFSGDFLKRLGLNSMRVYLSGNDLITWDTMKYRVDPDARELWGRVYPPMRVFNAGVNFKF